MNKEQFKTKYGIDSNDDMLLVFISNISDVEECMKLKYEDLGMKVLQRLKEFVIDYRRLSYGDMRSKEALEIMNTKEILDQDERNFCVEVLGELASKNLFYKRWDETWLNLNIYSEQVKDEFDLKQEQGL
jgi:hypothetical protein